MLNYNGTPILTTQRLLLRPFTVDDAPAMYQNWATDPLVTRYVTWNVHPSPDFTRELLTAWVAEYERPDYLNWVITLNGTPIGNIAVFDRKYDAVELGYCMSSAHWNRGYMTETVTAVRDYLFREVGIYRLVIRHDVHNPASGMVAKKIGCTWEGCQRSAIVDKDGERADINVLSLLRPEWEKLLLPKHPSLTLDTPHLTLRPATTEDFDAVHAYAGDPSNTYYMAWGTNDERATREYLRECEKAWAREDVRDHEFVMVEKATGKVVGGCGLYLDNANLGWILHRDYWNRGYTTEAARAMIEYAFEKLGVHRLTATCDAENIGSWRVMEKCGMRREACFRQAQRCHGAWHDRYVYAILKEEWEQR